MTDAASTQALKTLSVIEAEIGTPTNDAPEQLAWDSKLRRTVTVYVPLAIFVLVLLFPFYWMVITSIKPDNEMYDYARYSPFWVSSPTLRNFHVLLFETSYPHWLFA